MPTQKQIWEKEHKKPRIFTRIHTEKPSESVTQFAEFLKKKGFTPSNTHIVDIGSGKGRNSLYLAKEGFNVISFDFSKNAIEVIKNKNIQNLESHIVDISKTWPLKDSSIDAIIDCNATNNVPDPGRTNAIKEAYRVFKKGGYYLFYGVKQLKIELVAGPDPNSFYYPETGNFEKQYTKEELIKAYQDFNLIDLKVAEGKDIIKEKEIYYSMWLGVFQK